MEHERIGKLTEDNGGIRDETDLFSTFRSSWSFNHMDFYDKVSFALENLSSGRI
jgi:hypothetical protein